MAEPLAVPRLPDLSRRTQFQLVEKGSGIGSRAP
jgi:hypothetical protein